jgi:hypothetical protein
MSEEASKMSKVSEAVERGEISLGMTAQEIRAKGIEVRPNVPDDAVLVVDHGTAHRAEGQEFTGFAFNCRARVGMTAGELRAMEWPIGADVPNHAVVRETNVDGEDRRMLVWNPYEDAMVARLSKEIANEIDEEIMRQIVGAEIDLDAVVTRAVEAFDMNQLAALIRREREKYQQRKERPTPEEVIALSEEWAKHSLAALPGEAPFLVYRHTDVEGIGVMCVEQFLCVNVEGGVMEGEGEASLDENVTGYVAVGPKGIVPWHVLSKWAEGVKR